MPLRKAPTARRAVQHIAHRRRAVLQHTTAALLAAATTAQSSSANIGGADYVIGGARLSEAITNPEGQVEAANEGAVVHAPPAQGVN